ncbi:MAG: Methionine synthase [Planctomycetes bacterium]|nr:Methionine synthase [Planctomycetota bacterium]
MNGPLPWLDRARAEALHAAADDRILLFDGAMGTQLQARSLSAADFGGPELEGCNENLNLTRPDILRSIHDGYYAAGADLVETNTFGGTPLVLAEYGLAAKAREINAAAARIARQSAAAQGGPVRFVAGSMGPTTKAISVTGGVTFPELREAFREQAAGLLDGGADLLLVETSQDTRNVKAALLGIDDAFRAAGGRVPVMTTCTIEPTGTMLAGQGVEAFWTSVAHADLFAVGMNCATGPEFMTDHLRSLAAIARHRTSCMPNAGLPDEDGRYLLTPDALAAHVARFVGHGWLNMAGGCCGTGPAHIAALAAALRGAKPRVPQDHRRTLFSGIDFLEITDEMRPVIVGERTNVIGSRKFKRLVVEGKFEEAADVGRAQVRSGAHMLDVCLANPDRDEPADMDRFLSSLVKVARAPFVIDSTDPAVIELALTWCQGKALINSVNLEDGEERFEAVVPLARKYGAGLVVGCIDEDPVQGMAVSRQRKLEVARRSHELLVRKYGMREEDLVFDPLVFPCATGAAEYVGSAVETIEGVRLIDHALPHCRTVLGISNVSFGLPESGREVLNAVFLYHCVKAGLDLAIVNSEGIERYGTIPEDERRLAEDLLWNRGADPVAAFSAHFRGRAGKERPAAAGNLDVDGRLARAIVEGTKETLVADLAEKLAAAKPLDIINGPLMRGMDEVGRLFNRNELIVAEVLQSAEVMKAAVTYLEPHMDRADSAQKGTIVLGTVKGDVHDIGKNLVDIILSNNGWKVVNLGIKVEPGAFVRAVREHRPDAIGLSGLLVKSAQQMIATAEDLRAAGIAAPILVGGAALSRNFTANRIRPAYGGGLVLYARDAMDGLALAERLRDPAERPALEELSVRTDQRAAPMEETAGAADVPAVRSAEVPGDLDIPPVPDLAEHRERWERLDDVWSWINPQMLLGRHMGLRDAKRKLEEGDAKAQRVEAAIDEVKEMARGGVMRIEAVWRFYEAEPDGNAIRLFRADGSEAARIDVPRQRRKDGLSIADYVLPPRDGGRDHVAVLVTTAGAGIRGVAERLKDEGKFVRCHALQALAVESAEAAAELLHARLRALWGFPDAADATMLDRFQAKYRGKRYSPGYPACPDLALQRTLFRLVDARAIGVELTDGDMMDPEASVSALVFHHPAARYFAC